MRILPKAKNKKLMLLSVLFGITKNRRRNLSFRKGYTMSTISCFNIWKFILPYITLIERISGVPVKVLFLTKNHFRFLTRYCEVNIDFTENVYCFSVKVLDDFTKYKWGYTALVSIKDLKRALTSLMLFLEKNESECIEDFDREFVIVF